LMVWTRIRCISTLVPHSDRQRILFQTSTIISNIVHKNLALQQGLGEKEKKRQLVY
jgi:hypothetical protein